MFPNKQVDAIRSTCFPHIVVAETSPPSSLDGSALADEACSLMLFGHHRSAYAVSGVLGCRGFAVESAAARICREAGARVMVNVLVRDLDLGVVDRLDARRLEIVADGLPLFGGAQLAIDTTLVSAIRQDGTPRRGAATRDGVALLEARRKGSKDVPRTHWPGR